MGNLDGKYLLDLGLSLAPEQILGKLVDGCGLGTLGNTDRKRGGVNVQNVAALDMPIAIVVVPKRRPSIIRMVTHDRLIEYDLAVALMPVHAVHHRTLADHGDRVTREVGSGHREQDHLVGLQLIAIHARKGTAHMRNLEIAHVKAAHGGEDKLFVVLDGVELLHDCLTKRQVLDLGLGDELAHKLGTRTLDLIESLGKQVLHINDLGAGATKQIGELVMLSLSILEIKRVMNPGALKILRLHVYQVQARSVHAYLLEGTNFAMNVQTFAHHRSFLD